MDIDEPGWPLIDDFFRAEADGRSAPTVRRYERVRRRLMSFLDTGDMSLGLGTQPAALLEAERQFHDTGAFWTLLGPEELICCLPSFLHETWLPERTGEARTQISLVGRLLTALRRRHDFDWRVVSCAHLEAQAAVEQARRDLADRPAEPWTKAHELPARMRRESGPEW